MREKTIGGFANRTGRNSNRAEGVFQQVSSAATALSCCLTSC